MYKRAIIKRQEILKCSKKAFIEKGYSSVTMKVISEVCGIGRSSLYYYFSSIEEFYNEVMMEEKKIIKTDTDIVENFLNALKFELINVDESLYRAVAEQLLTNGVNNCL